MRFQLSRSMWFLHQAGWELGLASVCVAFGFAALYSGPVYRAAAAAELGWGREAVAGAFALGFLATIPVPFLTGLAADRWGARRVLVAGTVATGLALFGAAATRTLWQWYVTAGIILGIGVRATMDSALLMASIGKRRGSSLGMVFGATGLGLTVGPPLAQIWLDAFGWRSELAWGGMAFLLLAAVVLRGSQQPTELPRAPSAMEAAAAGNRGQASAMLLTGFFIGNALLGLYDEAVYQHVYAHGRALGLSGPKAASVISAVSLAYMIGGVGGGILSDLIGRRRVLVMAALGAAASLLLLATTAPTTLWVWGGAFGLALGMSAAVRSAAWADAFAGPQLGRNVGIVTPGYSVGAAIATYGGASWLDRGGSFQAVYTAAAGAAVLWAILGAMLTRSGALPQGIRNVVRSAAYPPDAQKLSTAQQPEL